MLGDSVFDFRKRLKEFELERLKQLRNEVLDMKLSLKKSKQRPPVGQTIHIPKLTPPSPDGEGET